MMKNLNVLAGVAFSLVCVGNAEAAAEKVRSGYSGWFFEQKTDHVERMIDRLSENGMNAIDIKIQTAKKTYELEPHKDVVKAMVDRAHAKGLKFNVYLYPFPGTPTREMVVPSDDAAVWKRLFAHAFQWAKLRDYIGFDSLRFDIETIHCYEALDAAKLEGVRTAVAEFARALREIAPGLPLGYMPADHHSYSWAFDRALATDEVPAYLDAWDLYNGGGYTDEVGRRAEAARKAHPNNRFIAWLRPNAYRSSDIAVSAYHTLKNTDGYSMWTMIMLDDKVRKRSGYELPGKERSDDYWQAYKAANDAWKKSEEIPYRRVQTMVPRLDLAGLTFPDREVVPYERRGKTSLMLRDPQTVFVRAKAGDTLKLGLRHEAGSLRPVALHYAVVAPDGSVLRDEAVTPGGDTKFEVGASVDGLYAFLCTGGQGGQAWYRMTVDGFNWCVDGRKGCVYLFGPQAVCVPGADRGNPKLAVESSDAQSYQWRKNGADWQDAIGERVKTIDLQDGLVRIDFRELKKAGYYCQDFKLTFPDGKSPYVFCPGE